MARSTLIGGILCLLTSCCLATPVDTTSSQHYPPLVSTVWQSKDRFWLENMEQRPSGEILATQLNAPNVWQFDPKQPSSQTPVLVASFPGRAGCLGIAQVAKDVYTVIAGNFTLANPAPNFGAYGIFQIDLSRGLPAKVSKLVDIPDAGFLNGMTFIPPSGSAPKGAVLASDSWLGAIWALDLASLKVTKISQDPLMARCNDFFIGINGLRYHEPQRMLYFVNDICQGGFFASIGFDPNAIKTVGSASIVGGKSQGKKFDDFDLDLQAGKAYAAVGELDEIFSIDLKSGATELIGGVVNTTQAAEPTAVWIGRSAEDLKRGRIYITTAGGLAVPINGTTVVGGQLLAIDLNQGH